MRDFLETTVGFSFHFFPCGQRESKDDAVSLVLVQRCIASALLLLFLTGCFGPILTPDALARQKPASASAARVSSADADHQSPDATASAESAGDGSTILHVNDEAIEPIQMWKELHEELIAKSDKLLPEAWPQYLAERSAQWISEKVSRSLMYQRAKLRSSKGIEQSADRVVDTQIRKTVTEQYGGVQRRYEHFLASRGMTLEDVKAQVRQEVFIASFLDAKVKPLIAEPTRAELWKRYQTMVDELRKPERRSMSLIDIRFDKALPVGLEEPTRAQWDKSKQSARKRAEAALKELADGISFTEVAKHYSDGLRGPDGGAWGWVSLGSSRERYAPAIKTLFTLQEGQISNLLKTDDAFQLVRCDAIEPAFEASFPQVQEQLKDAHFRNAFNQRVSRLINELREKARIEPADLAPFHRAVVQAALEQLQRHHERTD